MIVGMRTNRYALVLFRRSNPIRTSEGLDTTYLLPQSEVAWITQCNEVLKAQSQGTMTNAMGGWPSHQQGPCGISSLAPRPWYARSLMWLCEKLDPTRVMLLTHNKCILDETFELFTMSDLVNRLLFLPQKFALRIYGFFFEKIPSEKMVNMPRKKLLTGSHSHFISRCQKVIVSNMLVITSGEFCLWKSSSEGDGI